MSRRDDVALSEPPGAVIHVRHAATLIPSDVREQFVLTNEAIAVRFPVSRLVVDPERFDVDEQEPMATRSTCLIIDAHSFAPLPLPYELDQNPDRPDICIGSDGFHTPPDLTGLAVALCREAGWTVAVNRPFAGALVPMTHFGKDARVHAVMIEVNRRLYLNEQSGARGENFDRCRDVLSGVLRQLIETGGSRGTVVEV